MGKKKNRIGYKYGKYDWDRCGLFIDSGYLNAGKYKNPKLLVRSGKEASIALPKDNNGYFHKFQPLYVNEKYVDAWRKQCDASAKKPTKKWALPSCTKQHATPGDNFGTFTTEYAAFSPLKRPQTDPKLPRSFIIKPAKKGGPGYADITFAQWEYISNGVNEKPIREPTKVMRATFHPKEYLGIANPYATYKIMKPVQPEAMKPSPKIFHTPFPKKPGNSHAGCFSPFPKWAPVQHPPTSPDHKIYKELKYWGRDKSSYVVSIINHKIKSACTIQNYQNFKPITYPIRKIN